MKTKNKKTQNQTSTNLDTKIKLVYDKCCESIAKYSIGFFEALAMIK
ncbi:MAG TPA: hypothetical protein VKN14_03580 [Flavobacteriaceae bacterium]|nr:hypothetical protein [Flavobacteriaceae bacterium]